MTSGSGEVWRGGARVLGALLGGIGVMGGMMGCFADPRQCESDASCFAGEVCQSERCVLMSLDQGSGDLGMARDMGPADLGADLKTEDLSSQGCSSSKPCAPGSVCDGSGTCVRVEGCVASEECTDAMACEAGKCVPVSCSFDGECEEVRGRCDEATATCVLSPWVLTVSSETGESLSALRYGALEDEGTEPTSIRYQSAVFHVQSSDRVELVVNLSIYYGAFTTLDAHVADGCTQRVALCELDPADPKACVSSSLFSGSVLLEQDRLIAKTAALTLSAGEHDYLLGLEEACPNGAPHAIFSQYQQATLSLDFTRSTSEPRRGYSVALKVQ